MRFEKKNLKKIYLSEITQNAHLKKCVGKKTKNRLI